MVPCYIAWIFGDDGVAAGEDNDLRTGDVVLRISQHLLDGGVGGRNLFHKFADDSFGFAI